MNYKEIQVESFGQVTTHIIIEREDGSFVSFPADPNNQNYIEFLEEIKKE